MRDAHCPADKNRDVSGICHLVGIYTVSMLSPCCSQLIHSEQTRLTLISICSFEFQGERRNMGNVEILHFRLHQMTLRDLSKTPTKVMWAGSVGSIDYRLRLANIQAPTPENHLHCLFHGFRIIFYMILAILTKLFSTLNDHANLLLVIVTVVLIVVTAKYAYYTKQMADTMAKQVIADIEVFEARITDPSSIAAVGEIMRRESDPVHATTPDALPCRIGSSQ